MSTIPITVVGAEALRKELHEMKTVHRPAVIAAIAEARSHGDLSENAEYDAAKERQGFIEGRIAELEKQLKDAELKAIAFSTMVDIAEKEFKIPIRKKFNTKP